jgi:hypothetical protein
MQQQCNTSRRAHDGHAEQQHAVAPLLMPLPNKLQGKSAAG